MTIKRLAAACLTLALLGACGGGGGSGTPGGGGAQVPTGNAAPVANAGGTQSVSVGTLVTLNGSGSNDSNGDPLTYQWTLSQRPTGSAAVLAGATSVRPTFTPDVAGSYVANLVVSDGRLSSATSMVTTLATPVNVAPVAQAGMPRSIFVGQLVQLDGSASTDANGDPLTYQWVLTVRPTGSAAALTGATLPRPSFTPDVVGTYVASLVVNDGRASSPSATVTLTAVLNAAPVADAGSPQNVLIGTRVTLNGSGSSDAERDPLTYQWAFSTRPAGSAAMLANAATVAPTFTPDVVGPYVLTLVVADGRSSSGAATVTVTAFAPPPPQAGVPGSYTLSGVIRTANVNTVDSDSNDPNQTGYRVNDTITLAQPLISPITVVGAVNRVGKGPREGRHFTLGDTEDWYRVTLRAGQVVELLVGLSEGADNDADLCIVKADGSVAGCSLGVGERECVRASTDGDYYISVDEFTSSSVYNLRIAAPGQGASCTNETAASSAYVANQLLAIPSRAPRMQSLAVQPTGVRQTRQQSLSRLRSAGLTVHEAATNDVVPLDLIQLPQQVAARAKVLGQLAGPAATDQRRQRLSAAGVPADIHPAVDALQLFRMAKVLRSSGAYESVEPNWLMELQGALTGTFPPSDRSYAQQRWHYEQIRLPEAMQRILGLPQQPSRRPVVAVIDSGVMLDHPDLRNQLLSTGRTFLTRNFVPGDADAIGGDEGARTTRDVFHGTHVAGTIAASTFDTGSASFGAGVAPMAQILPLRVFGGATAQVSDILEALKYAAALPNRSGSLPPVKADVINLSLGGSGSCSAAFQAVFNAVRTAGVMVVAAAGNDARNGASAPIGSPANCGGVIAVTATDALRSLAPYSNSGTQAGVAAPGGDTSVSTTGLGGPDGVYSTLGTFDIAGVRRPTFGPLQGTSMAAPHVAGVLALMRYVNPAITPDQVLVRLQAGALSDDLGPAGRDPQYGWGLINARKAVDAALALAQGGGDADVAPTPLVATPSSLDFGSSGTTVRVLLRGASGVSTERVVGFSSPQAARLSFQSTQVDERGHGEYTFVLNRAALPPQTQSYFSYIRVELEGGRTFDVPISFSVIAISSPIVQAQVGAVYVLLIDPDTGDVQRSVLAPYSNGAYRWSVTGYTKPRVVVLAGTDLDYDGFVCQLAEVCGGFPVLGTVDAMTVPLTGNRSDMSFTISPRGGRAAAAGMTAVGGAAQPTLPMGVRRR